MELNCQVNRLYTDNSPSDDNLGYKLLEVQTEQLFDI
jgi:hypothetical protein